MSKFKSADEAAILIQTKVPGIFYDQPGKGKSAMMESLAKTLGYHIETVILSQMEPPDVHGWLMPVQGELRIAPPPYIQRVLQAHAQNKRSIIFFDELTNTPRATQASALRGIRDRVFGEIPLPETVSLIAAANPSDTASDAHDLTPPFANRFVHLDYDLPLDLWREMMMEDFPPFNVPVLPPNWKDFVYSSRAIIGAFLKAHPTRANVLPKDEEGRAKAWPSYRTWEAFAAPLLAACKAIGASEEIRIDLITGAIGKGVAHEFITWETNLDLPDPEELLKNPTKFEVPKRGDLAYAVLANMTVTVLQNNTPKRWLAAWEVIEHYVDHGMADVAVSAANQLSRNQPAGAANPKQAVRFAPLFKAAKLI